MAITVRELAIHRGAPQDEDGNMSGQAFLDVGLDIIGGCGGCGATLAAYNAYPTEEGYWACGDCIEGHKGFDTVEEANRFIFASNDKAIMSDIAKVHDTDIRVGMIEPENVTNLLTDRFIVIRTGGELDGQEIGPMSVSEVFGLIEALAQVWSVAYYG